MSSVTWGALEARTRAPARRAPGIGRPGEWGVLEWFIVVQYLSTALFFLPGAQSIRIIIRALPFLVSGGLLFVAARRYRVARTPAGASLVLASLVLILVSMLHPLTQPVSGSAQLILQCCIVAPLFWVGRQVESDEHLERLLYLVLACSAASAFVGLLQVFYPDTFMPPEFNQLAIKQDSKILTSLSYEGVDGRRIIRPPGLTDMPGGAAGGGMLCALFGVAFASQPGQRPRRRMLFMAVAAVGFAVLYFAQVRSILIMTILCIGMLSALAARQGRTGTAAYALGIGAAVVIGAFIMAIAVGGEAIEERFTTITDRGLVDSYQQERGGFVRYTFEEIIPNHPFGIGVGRWGVMNLYFADHQDLARKSMHAEIQMTGWVFDGGVLLLLSYGLAITLSLLYAWRVARLRAGGRIAYLAALVFCAQLMVAGMSFAGPAFNTQLGIQFWTLAAALHAAHFRVLASRRAAAAQAIRRREALLVRA